MTRIPYEDRRDAGRALGEALLDHQARDDVIVLALPRGGVPVAYEVARTLRAPLDVLIVRKLGVPGHEELALGAIASGGARVLNDEIVRSLGIASETIDRVASRERSELQRREDDYRAGREAINVRDRTVILVDDGLATGATMLAAVKAVRQLSPKAIVVAIPVAPPQACHEFKQRPEVDEVVCPAQPGDFGGVGRWYLNFDQTTDEEVREILQHDPCESGM